MALSKVSTEDVRKARKAGFKKKCPKKPKQAASLATLESYVSRHNQWAKDVRAAIAANKKKETLKKAVFH